MENFTKNQIDESIETKKRILEDEEAIKKIEEIAKCILCAFKEEKKILVCGNGGSAADSQHFVAEFVSQFRLKREALPAIALTTNTSTLTSIGNDTDFDLIFARQVEALGNEGDILIGISTSGNSKDISEAFKQAKEKKMKVIALLGKDGGENKEGADLTFIVPSNDTPRIQEAHITIIHIICDMVEKELFGE